MNNFPPKFRRKAIFLKEDNISETRRKENLKSLYEH